MLNKVDALKIAKKLGAQISKKTNAHDIAEIFHGNILIAKFGIRRSSKKDIGHGHIPKELYMTPHNCAELARCNIQRDEWLEMLRRQGLL